MDTIGKVFKTEAGQRRRCMVCEGLFTRDEAKTHATVPCQPKPQDDDAAMIAANEFFDNAEGRSNLRFIA